MDFQREIINWYNNNKRDLPWRNTQNAYIIWLSEIIMQQTRVEQGLPYFNKFLENFPTVQDFAIATETQVLKLWQGLGYYSRGRNMHHTAQIVVNKYQGIFPVEHDALLKLKGIGEYTAAAISSFSSGEAKAVVDGNVFRVLARYLGISTPINSTQGKKDFYALANELLHEKDPGLYNQAIMEFGALQCKPKSPNCGICPLAQSCYALKKDMVNVLPVKLKATEKKHRHFYYLVCSENNHILVKKRNPGDIWQHLYDFPLFESLKPITESTLTEEIRENFGNTVIIKPINTKKQVLTHQIIHAHFFALENYMINFSIRTEFKRVSLDEFNDLPQPKIIHDFIQLYFKK